MAEVLVQTSILSKLYSVLPNNFMTSLGGCSFHSITVEAQVSPSVPFDLIRHGFGHSRDAETDLVADLILSLLSLLRSNGGNLLSFRRDVVQSVLARTVDFHIHGQGTEIFCPVGW